MVRLINICAGGIKSQSGALLAAGAVRFYRAGTTEPETVYQDRTLLVPHSNPATLDAAGRLIAYSKMRLKLVFESAAGIVIRALDNVGVQDSDIHSGNVSFQTASGLISNASGRVSLAVDGQTVELNEEKELSLKLHSVTTGKRNTRPVVAMGSAQGGTTGSLSDGTLAADEVGYVTMQGKNTNSVTAAQLLTLAGVSLVTSGRPAILKVRGLDSELWGGGAGTTPGLRIQSRNSGADVTTASITFSRNGSAVGVTGAEARGFNFILPWALDWEDYVAAGTKTYTISIIEITTGSGTPVQVRAPRMTVREG